MITDEKRIQAKRILGEPAAENDLCAFRKEQGRCSNEDEKGLVDKARRFKAGDGCSVSV